jgi:hypothetical protein
MTLDKVSSECFDFLCQFSFHQMLHTHPSSGACKISQLVADVPRVSPHSKKPKKKKKKDRARCDKYIRHFSLFGPWRHGW